MWSRAPCEFAKRETICEHFSQALPCSSLRQLGLLPSPTTTGGRPRPGTRISTARLRLRIASGHRRPARTSMMTGHRPRIITVGRPRRMTTMMGHPRRRRRGATDRQVQGFLNRSVGP